MNKKQKKINNINTGYVEVVNEPIHSEIFRNKHIRIYIATIAPGAGTLYHRHSEDTIYIVLEGGTISTKNYKGYKRSPVYFPDSFHFYNKILFAAQNIFTDSVNLPPKLFFCMFNKKHDSIHKATASNRNKENMRLMGVEITGDYSNRHLLTINNNLYRKEYKAKNFSIFHFKLGPGKTSGIHAIDFPSLIICISGSAGIDIKKQHYELKKENFLMLKSIDAINIINTGSGVLEMIVLALK